MILGLFLLHLLNKPREMQLFQLKNYNVIFEPITMTIKEFKAISDKNKNDALTLKEMSFIWFFTDVRSDFQNVIDEDKRVEEIKHSIALPIDWNPSKEVLNAIDYYKEYSKTPSSGLYQASMISAQYIEKQLRDPSRLLAEVDAKGSKVYKLTDITNLLKAVPLIMKNLHEARIQVIKEIEANSQLKGSKAKAMFEDGIG